MGNKQTKQVEPKETRFAKVDVIQSRDFTAVERDFLHVVLPDGEYTVDEARKLLEKKAKGVVK